MTWKHRPSECFLPQSTRPNIASLHLPCGQLYISIIFPMWLKKKCMNWRISQALMLPSAGRESRPHASLQVAKGTTRCQGKQSHTDVREESFLLHEKTSSTLTPPPPARNILCINMARGWLCSSGRSADNNPDAEVFMSLHSRPHCQHANVLSTWIYLQLWCWKEEKTAFQY